MDDLFDPRRPPKPERLETSLWRALDAAKRHIDLGEPLSEAILPTETRSRLVERRERLQGLMRSGNRNEILAAFRTLVDMRGGHKASSLEEAKELAEQRVNDLGIVPIWALWDAATATRRGLVGRGGSKPKDGELIILARRYAEEFFKELELLDRVLRERIVSEPALDGGARKRELAQKLRALAATLGRQGDQATRR